MSCIYNNFYAAHFNNFFHVLWEVHLAVAYYIVMAVLVLYNWFWRFNVYVIGFDFIDFRMLVSMHSLLFIMVKVNTTYSS